MSRLTLEVDWPWGLVTNLVDFHNLDRVRDGAEEYVRIQDESMPNKREVLREGLERNEVFFRTGAAILLSLLSIYLAFTANLISTKQVAVAERELEILESETLPQLEAFAYSDWDGLYVYISNIGGPVRRLTVDIETFLSIEILSHPDGAKVLFLPVTADFSPNKPDSLNLDYPPLVEEGQRYIVIYSHSDEGPGLGGVCRDIFLESRLFVERLHFVRVAYADRLDRLHTEVLFAPQVRKLRDPYALSGQSIEEFLLNWGGGWWRNEMEYNSSIVTPRQVAEWSGIPLTDDEIRYGVFRPESLTGIRVLAIYEHYLGET